MTCAAVLECRKGASGNFVLLSADAPEPLPPYPAQHTFGVFRIGSAWAPDATIYFEGTTDDGTVDLTAAADGKYFVYVGATVTKLFDLLPPPEGLELAALLRVSDPDNPDDVVDYALEFVLLPELGP